MLRELSRQNGINRCWRYVAIGRVLTCKWSASCAVVSGFSTPLKTGETKATGSDDVRDLTRRACAEFFCISILHVFCLTFADATPRICEGYLLVGKLLGSQLSKMARLRTYRTVPLHSFIKHCAALQNVFSINFKMIAPRFLCHDSHRIVAATRRIFTFGQLGNKNSLVAK